MLRSMAASLLVFVFTLPSQAQGILDRARQDAGRPSPATPNNKSDPGNSSQSASGPDSDDILEDFKGFFGMIGFGALASPFWLPPFLLHDPFPAPGKFSGYPYALPTSAYIQNSDFLEVSRAGPRPDLPTAGHAATPVVSDRDFFDPQRMKSWATRASFEAGTDFSGLTRIGGRFALDTEWRVGVTSSLDYYRERLPCGCVDRTVLGDINLTLRFAQAEWLQMYTGLGARGMFDGDRTRGGVNFQYGADFFPADPVVVSTLFEMGNLDRAFVTRVRGSVGIQLRHAELFAGYDWLRIGAADLHGPMVGLRLWF